MTFLLCRRDQTSTCDQKSNQGRFCNQMDGHKTLIAFLIFVLLQPSTPTQTGSFAQISFQTDLIIGCSNWKCVQFWLEIVTNILWLKKSSFLNFSPSLDTQVTLRCLMVVEWNKFWSKAQREKWNEFWSKSPVWKPLFLPNSLGVKMDARSIISRFAAAYLLPSNRKKEKNLSAIFCLNL